MTSPSSPVAFSGAQDKSNNTDKTNILKCMEPPIFHFG